jgi:hypothetical protein
MLALKDIKDKKKKITKEIIYFLQGLFLFLYVCTERFVAMTL